MLRRARRSVPSAASLCARCRGLHGVGSRRQQRCGPRVGSAGAVRTRVWAEEQGRRVGGRGVVRLSRPDAPSAARVRAFVRTCACGQSGAARRAGEGRVSRAGRKRGPSAALGGVPERGRGGRRRREEGGEKKKKKKKEKKRKMEKRENEGKRKRGGEKERERERVRRRRSQRAVARGRQVAERRGTGWRRGKRGEVRSAEIKEKER